LYSTGYTLSFFGRWDFMEFRELANDEERRVLLATAAELGFEGSPDELQWRNQHVSVGDRSWTARVETGG
jgi:hypothetical protein